VPRGGRDRREASGSGILSMFDETDLVNIPNHHIYLKMMIDGHTSKAFSASTLPPRQSDFSYRKEIIASSREKDGTWKDEVEKHTKQHDMEIIAASINKQRMLF